MITIEQNIEKAITSLIEAAIQQSAISFDLQVITTVHDTESQSDRVVTYPCCVVACDPFVNDTPGSPLGYCSLLISNMTDQNYDNFGVIVNESCNLTFPVVKEGSIGPLIHAPWLLCGINDTGTTEVSVDEEANTNIRTREYTIALARMPA